MLIGCGALGMVITIPLLYIFIFDTPREARWISDAETDYIEAHLEQDAPAPADWSFLKAPVFWMAVCGGMLNNYCAYGVINWLPTYFVNQRGMDFSALWYAASLPYAAGVVAFLLFAYLGDKTNRRITLAGLGFLGATVSIFLAINAPSVPLAVRLFQWHLLPNRVHHAGIRHHSAHPARRHHRQSHRYLQRHIHAAWGCRRRGAPGTDCLPHGKLRRWTLQHCHGGHSGLRRNAGLVPLRELLAVCRTCTSFEE